jgi:predicted transcriptional regulator
MKGFQSLSDSEMEVMEVIWDSSEPMTASQLLTIFAYKGWKIQTLSTFLTRLVDKGVLTFRKQGKTNFYSPAVTREGYNKLEARHVVDSMYNGSMLDFLAAFYGGDKGIQEDELAELKQWFNEVADHGE